MNKLAVIIVLLCSCATACDREDTIDHEMWPDPAIRAVEPRLTASEWQPCRRPPGADPYTTEAVCGPARSSVDDDCPHIATHEQALRVLESRPRCTDKAIEALEQFAALSDLAAAYYLRSQREQRDEDLLEALAIAQRAITSTGNDPATLFNLALIQEALGLTDQAITTWNGLLKVDRSEWAHEARQHLERLLGPTAAEQWKINHEKLPAALKAGDRAVVRALIAAFPTPALDYYEKELLAQNDAAAATLLGDELSLRLGGDQYTRDVAAVMSVAREGHIEFRDRQYAEAARLLRNAGSPLYITAHVEQALALDMTEKSSERALALLDLAARDARARRYAHLLARIHSTQGHIFYRQGRYPAALESCKAALKAFSDLRDTEMVLSMLRTNVGTHRTLGKYDLAWHGAVRLARALPRMTATRRINSAIGEIATSASALRHPRAAFLYQDMAVSRIQRELAAAAPDDVKTIANLKMNLAIARRARAEFALEIGEFREAEEDVREAVRLTPDKRDDRSVTGAYRARVHEVEGRAARHPRRAFAAFTEALNVIPGDELWTFRAALYAQRAEAARRLGNATQAARDLTAALRELRQEELRLLGARKRGEGENYWSAYFSRFDDTYEKLIRHYMDAGQPEQAFNHEERSRAFEPVNLILELELTPKAFRQFVAAGESTKLGRLQAVLPPGTVLLQYTIHDDLTYVWVVSRERFFAIRLEVGRNRIRQLAAELQRAIHPPDERVAKEVLQHLYEELFRKPLEDVGTPARLVIIPDDAMHGLPFAALHDERTNTFLIERMPIETAGSATLYVFSVQRNAVLAPMTARTALLIGNPELGDPLPQAETEVEQIRGVYAPHAEVLTGSEATVSAFLKHVDNQTIIHFAGHFLVDADEPWKSTLGLADGTLEAQELLKKLKLNRTRLVMLSACSSATGRSVGPEGLGPLVRPILTAGVPAVVGTLWNLDDATAEQLSVSFHRHYGKSGDAAVALRDAQVELLKSDKLGQRHIMAWAPFQLVGHTSASSVLTQERVNGGKQIGFHRQDSLQRDDGLRPER